MSLRWAHMPFCWFCHDAAQIVLLSVIFECPFSHAKISVLNFLRKDLTIKIDCNPRPWAIILLVHLYVYLACVSFCLFLFTLVLGVGRGL